MEISRDLVGEIKQLIDTTSRVDERVKIIGESQQQINIRLNHFIDEHNSLVTRVHVLESRNGNKLQETLIGVDEKLLRINSRVEILESIGSPKQLRFIEDLHELRTRIKDLEIHKQGTIDRIKKIMSYIWQGIFIVVLCYVLYRLGLNLPSVP